MSNMKDIYLQYLNACINAQYKTTKAQIDVVRPYFSNNRHSAGFSKKLKELTFIPTVDHAEGAYFYDIDGNRFIDLTMGFGVHLFGHKVPFLEEAIKDQLKHGTALGPIYKDAAQVAQLIHDMTSADRSAFYNSGTEAVMVAMRIARAAIGKEKIVIFEGAYHGTHDSLLAMKSNPDTKTAITSVPGITQNLVDNTIILDFGSQESIRFIEKKSNEIAAVLIEPVQSRHPEGLNPQFLKDLRKVTAKHRIALLFDEIITGFRIANGGAAAYFGLEPDISIYGKILGGGMPIGVVAGKSKFMDYIDGGQWRYQDDSIPQSPTTFVAGTFCHHPLTMATAKATLLYLNEHHGDIQKKLNSKTDELCKNLNSFFKQEGLPIVMKNFGSLFRFQLKGNTRLLYHALLKEGIYIWEGRNCFLSTAHTNEDVEQLIRIVKKSCHELTAAGLLSFKKEKVVVPENSWVIQGAIEVDGHLNKEFMELACRYLIHATPALNRHHTTIVFRNLQKNENPDDWLHKNQKEATFTVAVLENKGKTVIQISTAKQICDGWSMILFFRKVAQCYTSLEAGKPLPEIDLQSEEKFQKWLHSTNKNNNTATFRSFPAQTIHGGMPLNTSQKINNGRLFAQLLASFTITLGMGKHRIGVPVAGQLVSRNPKVFGACTTSIPIVLDGNLAFEDLMKSSENQINDGKKNFRKLFVANGKPLPIIFNFDNLEMQWNFGHKAARLFPVDDKSTAHNLVCNVSKLNSELKISLKYNKDEIPGSEAQYLLTSLIDNTNKYLNT